MTQMQVSDDKKNAYYRFANWLHQELFKRQMTPTMLCALLDSKVPMWTIWRWLRGETEPNGWQLALLMQRLQTFIDPRILEPVNSNGAAVKGFPQTYFPGMGPRKKRS